MSHTPLVSALTRLLKSTGRLASSEFSSEERAAIAEFSRHKGGLRLVMIARNARYAITNRDALEAHLGELDPAALAACKQANTAGTASSKDTPLASAGTLLNGPFYLLLRALSPTASWLDTTGTPARTLNVAQIEQTAGVAALALTVQDGWHSAEPLWLVESQAHFEHTDWLPASARGTLAYCQPQYSALVRHWLDLAPRTPAVHYRENTA